MTRVMFLVLALAFGPDPAANVYDVRLTFRHANVPLPQCDVRLVIDGATVAHEITGETGVVQFTGLAVERFEVHVKREGYFDRRAVWYNFARRDIVADVDLKKRTKWALTGSVRGKGSLVPGANVTVTIGADNPLQTTTAADGTFAFRELYDTECAFRVEASGFHTQKVWSANRPQIDLHYDVELRPKPLSVVEDWLRGEPEAALELERVGHPRQSVGEAEAVRALLSVPVTSAGPARLGPGESGPAGAITCARILCPRGAAPDGTLGRADALLTRWVLPYPRGVKGRVMLERDGGTTGWGGKGGRGR
jgi:hypothetical protein